MAEPTPIQLTISRSELGLGNLQLHNGAYQGTPGYFVVGLPRFSRPTVERQYAESVPWVDYEHMTHARKTNGNYEIQIGVQGASAADLKAKTDALEAAFSQFEFTIQQVRGGETRTWDCLIADIEWVEDDLSLSRNVHDTEFVRILQFTGPHKGEI